LVIVGSVVGAVPITQLRAAAAAATSERAMPITAAIHERQQPVTQAVLQPIKADQQV